MREAMGFICGVKIESSAVKYVYTGKLAREK